MPTITAIEFTHAECRVAIAETGKGKPALKHLFAFAIPRPEDPAERVEKRAALLRDALKIRKIKTGRVRVLIPKNEVMARMVTLPGTTEAELNSMARFEAERHIPFNPERHIVSHHVLTHLGVQGSQVLLTAVDQPVAKEYLDTCTAAGLTVEQLGVASLSMFNALSAFKDAEIADKVVALVNVGMNSTDFIIASNGVLNFTRSSSAGIARLMADLEEAGAPLPGGIQSLNLIDAREPTRFFRPSAPAPQAPATPPMDPYDSIYDMKSIQIEGDTVISGAGGEPAPKAPPSDPGTVAFTDWLQRLMQEIRRTYEYARREFNCPPISEFYFTGEGTLLRNLASAVEQALSTTCTAIDPTNAFDVPPRLDPEIALLRPSAAALAGQFMAPGKHTVQVNLLPPEYMEKRASKRQQQSLIVSAALLVGLLALLYVWASDAVARQREGLAMLKDKNRDMKSQVDELESMRSRLQIMEKSFKDSHSALKILDDISGLAMIPDTITLTRFEYKKDDEVKIQGHAKTFADINRFRMELEKMGFFSDVKQDEGSGKPKLLPRRVEPIFEFLMTAKFAKGNARAKRTPERTAAQPETTALSGEEPNSEQADTAAEGAAAASSTEKPGAATETDVVIEDLETTAGDAPEPPAENPTEETTTDGAQ